MELNHRQIFTADARFAVNQADGKHATLTGYALVWNVASLDRGGYQVRLMPNSARFMAETHALYHHEFSGGPLGDTVSNSLRILPPDGVGVPFELDLPDTTLGRDTLELVRTKRLRGMSFAMVNTPKGEKVVENGRTIFNAKSYDVDEISLTPIPSFTGANVGLKPDNAGFAARTAQALQLHRFTLSAAQAAIASL